MKTCMFYLLLWMLLCVVTAHNTNFTDISPLQDVSIPMAKLASRRPTGGEGASEHGADALGGAFHQPAQWLLRVQEFLRLQQHKMATALRVLEQKLHDRDREIGSLRKESSSSIQRIEKKVNEMERRLVPSTRRGGDAAAGGHVSITELKSRMDSFGAKLQKALQEVFPNMEEFWDHFSFVSSEPRGEVPLVPIALPNITSTFSYSSDSTTTSPSSSLLFHAPSVSSSILASSSNSTSVSPSHSLSHSPSTPPSVSNPFSFFIPASPRSNSPSHFLSHTTATPSSVSNSFSSLPPASPRSNSPSHFPSHTTATPPSVSNPYSFFASASPRSHSPSHSLLHTTSTPPSVSNAHSSFPPASPRPTAASDEELMRLQVELRVLEVRQRIARTEAALSPLREQLLSASYSGRLKEVRRLLDAGADVNSIDSEGMSPLHNGIRGGESNEPVVSLLLGRGADVNAIDVYARTALHHAAWRDRSGRIASLVLGAGGHVDLGARNEYGVTPLHFAAYKNNEAAVRALLEAGASKSLRTWGAGWGSSTPYDLATSDAVRKLLRP